MTPNPLQGYPTASSPALDDWLYIQGATNDVRKLSPTFYQKVVNNAYIVVPTTISPTGNGTALLAAYATAKTLIPNGLALSAINRAVVVVPPGRYDLGTDSLILDTNFVDVVGLSTSRADAYITSACVDGSGIGTITQLLVAPDVVLANFSVNNTGGTRTDGDSNDTAAFFVDDNGIVTRLISNVEFMDNSGVSWGMRQSREYAGHYKNCLAPTYSFGGHGGVFSGSAEDCTVGDHSFADSSTIVNGAIIKNCTGGDNCFGNSVETSVWFFNCIAGSNSFGATTFVGTAYNCNAGANSFGRSNFLGVCYNCLGAGNECFGGNGGSSGGRTYNCVGGAGSFGGVGGAFSGIAFACIAGTLSFGGSGGTYSGYSESCQAGGGSFGDAGTFSGKLFRPIFDSWTAAWAPTAFTGLVISADFSPVGTDLDGATIPDGATGAFEFCTFRKTGTGTPLGIASGSATINLSYCKFNTAGGVESGITNGIGVTLAAAFNIGNTAV